MVYCIKNITSLCVQRHLKLNILLNVDNFHNQYNNKVYYSHYFESFSFYKSNNTHRKERGYVYTSVLLT